MGLLKKTSFFTELIISSSVNPLSATALSATPLRAAPLKCASMTNQECKVRPEIVNVMSPYFILLVLKQVNAVVAVTISLIHMQKRVFLIS